MITTEPLRRAASAERRPEEGCEEFDNVSLAPRHLGRLPITIMNLRFDEENLAYWAKRYSEPPENVFENEIAPKAEGRGYLTQPEFIALRKWKSPRIQPLVKANRSDAIEGVTRAALESRHENVKILLPQLLTGVSWPTASVVLHFCDTRPY